ncbi:cholestenol delta-isomerase, putative [Trichophyton benhamiae CBS 112371]|uniref:Cholestenol delta-isomerase, putative n=1 Tax=Arthroderma benhamiae (strain ATCC MYA-4681 / CBS 112371) TaxID=663331 RepID=D4B078_ARTBC|nr:cholestenol delta-isomerase, putative [Trichophyton benhamiae CBS 112371]EFE31230.1 cholestenol delta-isomerase, putative [Trichophyton benhamiae CBS 112371]
MTAVVSSRCLCLFNNSTTTPIHLHRAEVNREERETRDERAAMEPAHPYYPLDAKVVGYLANDWDVPTLVCAFLGGWGALLLLTLAVVSVARPSLKMGDKVAILWFVLNLRDLAANSRPGGSIHFFFEGYFVYNHTRMAPAQDFFGQLWKEYSLSDSRYLTSDPFVLCMETITAVCWGPLCFLLAYLITVDHPLRHSFQVIVSLGQIYGDILYYATSMFDHYFHQVSYCRPEGYYFWFYYFTMNAIWIVVPACKSTPTSLSSIHTDCDRLHVPEHRHHYQIDPVHEGRYHKPQNPVISPSSTKSYLMDFTTILRAPCSTDIFSLLRE